MNRITTFIVAFLLLAALVGCGKTDPANEPVTGALTMPDYEGELSGRVVRAEDGSVLLVSNDVGVVVLTGSMNFDGLGNGDWLTIYFTAMTKSIPAQASVVEMTLMQKGTLEDVPEQDIQNVVKYGFTVAE